jgi:glyoxylase-like metal-dependent hydrolase (beta-lactamase superfamily II)
MTDIPEIEPAELAKAVEEEQPIQLVDVRAPGRVASGRIDQVPDESFYNIVGSHLVTMQSAEETGLDPSIPVAVVCGHGNSSRQATQFLNQLGFSARSVTGGMAAWMHLAVTRPLDVPPSVDGFLQFDRVGKRALGYVLISDGEALVVDPPRESRAFVSAIADAGATLTAVAETHCHADYISGGPALARRFGVPYYIHPADTTYAYDGTPGTLEYDPLEDGGSFRLGRAEVRCAHTPGHTEGHVTFMVDDVALTGDFIFVESVGRPDLAGKTDEWSEALWQSLTRATTWSPNMKIYPAHYGSERERNDDHTIGRPLGEIRDTNEALKLGEADFKAWVKSRAGSFPDAYRTIKAVNVGLMQIDEMQADELEVGKNECAI